MTMDRSHVEADGSDVVVTDGVITLRHMTLADAGAHLAGEDDAQIRWLGEGRQSTRAAVEAWIERNRRSWALGGPYLGFGIVAPTGELTGMVEGNTDYTRISGLRPGEANVSYALYPLWRGIGFASRAIRLFGDFLGERDLVPVIRVNPENVASVAVAERSGYVRDGVAYPDNGDPLLVFRPEGAARSVDKVGGQRQYDAFADGFLDHARDGLYNAHLDRPACLGLLGDVYGKRVLDAACGPGLYARELLKRGASVVGFDQSPRMIELARGVAPEATLRAHALAEPLDWIEDQSVDLVLCALAIQYVDDRVGALRELRRVMRRDGALVLSRQHPTADWQRLGGSYFANRVIEETWSRGWQVRYWSMPLEESSAEFVEAGFLVERIHEPRPQMSGRSIDPDDYERLHREPSFIAYRLVPDPRR